MTQQPIDPNSPEGQRMRADNLLAQAAVQQAKVNKMRSTANVISSASTILIILGCAIPCIVILIGSLFFNGK